MYAIGLSGSLSSPSRTLTLVEAILQKLKEKRDIQSEIISVSDLAPDLGHALNPAQLPASISAAFAKLRDADILVIASPMYKASYSGLLKHFLDLLDPKLLKGKIAILAASGGSANHALAIEHQLRPLASFFGILSVPTGIYVLDTDFTKNGQQYELTNPDPLARIDAAAAQALALLERVEFTRAAE